MYAGHWFSDAWTISGYSWSAPAKTGVWYSSSVTNPVSVQTYCETYYCQAYKSWGGPWPDGYATIHNHGGSTAVFIGYAQNTP